MSTLKIFKNKFIYLFVIFITFSCTPNNPYKESEKGKNTYYSTFTEPPKHLDPAIAYSSDEYPLIGLVYEPLYQYHYLKRPYELEPLIAKKIAKPKVVAKDRIVYEIEIKENIMYGLHPAFATNKKGEPFYADLKEKDLENIEHVSDFKEKSTRELVVDDFIYQIERMADPRTHTPIAPILSKYILGFQEFSDAISAQVEKERARRKADQGAAYSMILDEDKNPIIIDYAKIKFPGLKKINKYKFQIILKRIYPQFKYWLAMPFFSPMPEEAVRFYKQAPLIEKNIILDRFPLGTGPYVIKKYDPNMEIVFVKNDDFRLDTYPTEGEEGDKKKGLLEDAGLALPFIDKVVFKLEKEAIPRWNKFLQGYYDASGITSDSFDQVITSKNDVAETTDIMKEKAIELSVTERPLIYYFAFNMNDEVVGGYSADKQKLRQAISIALDSEEYIEIFLNNRGTSAMSPLPSEIFGSEKGSKGCNSYTHNYNQETKTCKRKSIEEAKELLAQAGYKDGRDKQGKPLIIGFDNSWNDQGAKARLQWMIKKLKKLNIQLENRSTDYNRFREKTMKGNFQMLFWGWNADYPDPENFFFLFLSSNGKVKYQGENVANYENEKFDKLYKKMESLENTDERLNLIREMNELVRADAPWVFFYLYTSYGLHHSWLKNSKPNVMAENSMKYIRIDATDRMEKRSSWNKPLLWPLALILILLILSLIPAFKKIREEV